MKTHRRLSLRITTHTTAHTPSSLHRRLPENLHPCLFQGQHTSGPRNPFTVVTARPLLTFRSWGSRCEISQDGQRSVCFGNPWTQLKQLQDRFEIIDQLDVPFPTGIAGGYWGYDLKHFCEPSLKRLVHTDVELPDCLVGFYPSLVVFEEGKENVTIVATGMNAGGDQSPSLAEEQTNFWLQLLDSQSENTEGLGSVSAPDLANFSTSLNQDQFIERVNQAQRYIRAGDIYQVNLARRFSFNQTPLDNSAYFEWLQSLSPARFGARISDPQFELISSSPELFLEMSGPKITTQPIKGTRPRHIDPTQDAQLSFELQTSEKEQSELIMITDLMRNDLGRICTYGSVETQELLKLHHFSHVHHLESQITGQLRPEYSHLDALEKCFPGGSITGAPKIRAMQIIEALEPVSRGPYTGCIGYLGFNRESLLSIAIRITLLTGNAIHYYAGSGIVADSDPIAEYEETLHKAAGFFQALGYDPQMATEAR